MPKATREEQRAYQRAWVANRRAAWLADKCCVRCGATSDLHVHHRDPDQKVTHRIWSWGEARRLVELAKCEVLCKPCHVALHAKLAQRHGTMTRYRRGCRCDLCKHARAVESAVERERRKQRKAGVLEVAA